MTTQSLRASSEHAGVDADRSSLPGDTEPFDLGERPPAAAGVTLTRLYLLRLGYALVGFGLAVVKWPSLVQHPQPWPLMDGVVSCMLVALSLLALLGLRYPLQLLPVLLFEVGWKVIWMGFVAAPLWAADRLDPATASVLSECVLVVVIVVVIPWRYVLTTYLRKPGDRWR